MPDEPQDLIAYVYGESWCRVTHTIDEEIKVSFVDAYLSLRRKQMETGYDWRTPVPEFPEEAKIAIAELKQRETELQDRLHSLQEAKTYGDIYQAVYDELYKVIHPQRRRLEDEH